MKFNPSEIAHAVNVVLRGQNGLSYSEKSSRDDLIKNKPELYGIAKLVIDQVLEDLRAGKLTTQIMKDRMGLTDASDEELQELYNNWLKGG